MTTSAAVIAVGDELLRGDTVDTNGPWIGRTLAEAGVGVVARLVVGDSVPDIVTAIRVGAAQADLVLVCGGLGPTSDDRTREALAMLLDEPLQPDPDLVAGLADYFAVRRRPMPSSAAVQALRPASARALPNSVGSAPGLVADAAGARIVLLPGPPRELRPMVSALLPELTVNSDLPPSVRRITVALLPESLVAERIASAVAAVDVGYYPSPGRIQVRLSGAAEAVTAAAEQAQRALGDVVLDGEPAEVVLAAAQRRGWTIASAESLTGGLIGAAFTAVPGASATYRGGAIAYATDLKVSLLHVPAELIAERGTVDRDVALAMARGAATALGADIGVATTGVAGPDPIGEIEPGTAWVAVAGAAGERAALVQATGDRELVRTLTVAHALDLARRTVLGLPDFDDPIAPG